MAEDLAAHAATRRDRAVALETARRTALDAARTAADRTVPDPTAVPVDTWPTALGSTQYLAATVAREATLAAEETRLRAALAAIPTPADHAALVAALTSALTDRATTRVLRRDAAERVDTAAARKAVGGAALAAAQAATAAAGADLAAVTGVQTAIAAERAALAALVDPTDPDDPPAADLAASAAALRADPVWTAADAAWRSRLPADLAQRATERAAEAVWVRDAAVALAAAARGVADGLDLAATPTTAAVARADRDLGAARAAVRAHVVQAPALIARARAVATRLAALPALTADETATLDPTSPRRPDAADAVAAVALERTLALAWQDREVADRAYRVARWQAIAANPDADPETAPAVVAARTARDADDVQGDLDRARAAYPPAAQAALDAWEQAAPGWLWDAARAFLTADADLARLADPATAAGLLTALDTAVDAVAAADDAAATAARARGTAGAVTVAAATAAAHADAVLATHTERVDAYVRGDGRGGRHVDEC